MKYRMLKSIGSAAGWVCNAGDVIEEGAGHGKGVAPGETLEGWVRAGLAEPIPEAHRAETTALAETETAARPDPRRRGGRNRR